MKIHVYSVMRDEIKILPYFLRHYETFADRIFVWEDQSVDGTREMLEAHPLVTLLPLDFHGPDDVYYVQHLWPQYKRYSTGQADWVMQVDADEFVWGPEIKEILQDYTNRGIKKCRLTGYTMWAENFPTTTGQIYEEVQMGWLDNWVKKTILFNPEIHISHCKGRHQTVQNSHSPTWFPTDVRILHFRTLGMDYVIEREKKNYTNMNLPYDPNRKHNLPCNMRGPVIDFINNYKHLLVNAITTRIQLPETQKIREVSRRVI